MITDAGTYESKSALSSTFQNRVENPKAQDLCQRRHYAKYEDGQQIHADAHAQEIEQYDNVKLTTPTTRSSNTLKLYNGGIRKYKELQSYFQR
jgi:hypothetical protein